MEPLQGFTDEQLLALVDKQNDIMDHHEDYAALRSVNTKVGGKGDKTQIAKGVKGISKLHRSETLLYPSYGALALSSSFIPLHVFGDTEIVEYRNGRATYISSSTRYLHRNESKTLD